MRGPIILLLTSLLLGAPAAAAQEGFDAQLEFGEISYRVFCSACHGIDGRGRGPAAALLDTPPADLTRLASRNGGVFPTRRVAAAIDGRLEVPGHLDFSMPRWSELSADELKQFPTGAVLDAFIRRRIARIVAYLATIQEQ